jgi:AraC-like DNA-binding protein
MHLHAMKLSLRSYGPRVVTHSHDFHQIVLPVTGVLDQRIGPLVGTLSARQFGIIGRGEPHAFCARERNCFVILDTVRPVTGLGSAICTLDSTLAELIRYAASELTSRALPAGLEFHLATLLAERIQRSTRVSAGSRDPVEQAIALMTVHYADKIIIAELAKKVGLSASQFHVRFRQKTGKTPADMLADIRLDSASVMLRETDAAIADVALAVGFSDQTVLTRSFRRRRGTTPDVTRRRG